MVFAQVVSHVPWYIVLPPCLMVKPCHTPNFHGLYPLFLLVENYILVGNIHIFFWVNNVHVSWTLLVTSSSFLRKVNTNTCLKRTSKQKSTLKNKNSSRCFQDSALKAPFKALIVSRSLQGVVLRFIQEFLGVFCGLQAGWVSCQPGIDGHLGIITGTGIWSSISLDNINVYIYNNGLGSHWFGQDWEVTGFT